MQQPPQGPYQNPQGQPGYYPPQPRGMQPPRKSRKGAIGCGVAVLLFLVIGSCNAILSGGKGVGNTASQSGVTVATMPPRATTTRTQPTHAPTTAPTQAHAQPTPAPTQPPAVPTSAPTQAPAPVPTQAPPRAPAPTQPPPVAPTQPPVTGVNGNPWGYNFSPGSFITNPPADFCSYFACITTFWKGVGHVEECADTTFSLSGGISGSCSRHGGDMRPLYAH